MGDMKEQFEVFSEIKKEQRESRFNKWIKVIEEKGGKELTYGVYRFATSDSALEAIKIIGEEKLKLIFRIGD